MLLLSRFSCVRLCATPQKAAHQAPSSLGFSRQEQWSGLPFLLQLMKVKSESEVDQQCPILSDPMDCSLPGSSVHGIFQARVLGWGAIAFSESDNTKGKLFICLSHCKLQATNPNIQNKFLKKVILSFAICLEDTINLLWEIFQKLMERVGGVKIDLKVKKYLFFFCYIPCDCFYTKYCCMLFETHIVVNKNDIL